MLAASLLIRNRDLGAPVHRNAITTFPLREFVQTHISLAPGASQGGLGAAGQIALRADSRDPRDRIAGRMPPGHFPCAGIVLESRVLKIGRAISFKTYDIYLGRPM